MALSLKDNEKIGQRQALFNSWFIDSSLGKESTCNARDPSLIPGSGRSTWEWIVYPLHYSWASLVGRSPGEGKGYPLQYSGLGNSMDCIVHGVAKSWTWLNNFHFCFQSTVGSPSGQFSEEASWQESPKKIVSESSAFWGQSPAEKEGNWIWQTASRK